MNKDISPDFRWNRTDEKVAVKIMPHEATPEAVRLFDKEAYKLTNYGYWFLLSTLWVSYTGWSDLGVWRKLFSSPRPNRETCIMKPSELEAFRILPEILTVFRAHRPGEEDWISYTLSPERAAGFATQRGVGEIRQYRVRKTDALCLFLRRGEHEVIVLDKAEAEYVQTIHIVRELPDTWLVWDDGGLTDSQADDIMQGRVKHHPDYEFRVIPSPLHGEGFFAVEGMRRPRSSAG